MFNSYDKEDQVEFFGDLSGMAKKPKKKRFILGKIALTLSYENLMILVIGLIMLFIVCYSLGVERGKQLTEISTGIIENEQIKIEEAPKSETSQPVQKRPRIKVAQTQVKARPPAYIQVATFRTDKYAKKEMRRLKNRGYQSFLVLRGGYREVCVGGYDDKAQAKEALKELKKMYADCFLRTK
jgi:hypothetical protein